MRQLQDGQGLPQAPLVVGEVQGQLQGQDGVSRLQKGSGGRDVQHPYAAGPDPGSTGPQSLRSQRLKAAARDLRASGGAPSSPRARTAHAGAAPAPERSPDRPRPGEVAATRFCAIIHASLSTAAWSPFGGIAVGIQAEVR